MKINNTKSVGEIVREFVRDNETQRLLDLKSLGDLTKRIIDSYEIEYDKRSTH